MNSCNRNWVFPLCLNLAIGATHLLFPHPLSGSTIGHLLPGRQFFVPESDTDLKNSQILESKIYICLGCPSNLINLYCLAKTLPCNVSQLSKPIPKALYEIPILPITLSYQLHIISTLSYQVYSLSLQFINLLLWIFNQVFAVPAASKFIGRIGSLSLSLSKWIHLPGSTLSKVGAHQGLCQGTRHTDTAFQFPQTASCLLLSCPDLPAASLRLYPKKVTYD